MADNTTTVTLQVDALSQYGFKTGSEYVNWSKNLKDAEKGKVVPGGSYEMVIFTSGSGKRYVNSVLSSKGAIVGAKVVEKVMVKHASTFAKLSDNGMSKEDWAAKDKRISRQGVIQAAVQAVAPLVALDQVYTEAEKLAKLMLVFVNE